MYTSFFGLTEKPFAITPDPRYLYLSERHAEALAHLLYGINEAGGFIQLTGEVGTGKTTIVRTLLSRVPQHADVAADPESAHHADGVPAERSARNSGSTSPLPTATASRRWSMHSIATCSTRTPGGRRVVVIVDEAQNLSTAKCWSRSGC